MLVPIGHFDFAPRQAENRGPVRRADEAADDVVQEGVHRLRQRAMPVEDVQQLVEQEQHRAFDQPDHAVDGVRSRGRLLGGRAECRDPLVAGKLAGHVDPRGFPSGLRVPGIAHEDGHFGLGHVGQPGFVQEAGDARAAGHGRPAVGQVPKGGKHVRLAAAHLGDQGLDRRRILCLAGQSPQDQARVLHRARVKQVREKNSSGFL